MALPSIQIVRSAVRGTPNQGWTGQLNRALNLEFDTAGKLLNATVQRSGGVTFPKPLPFGITGVTVPLGSRVLNADDVALRAVADQVHDVAARAGGITQVESVRGARLLGVQRGDAARQEHVAGAPTFLDAAILERTKWGTNIKVGASSVEVANLGQAILRLSKGTAREAADGAR